MALVVVAGGVVDVVVKCLITDLNDAAAAATVTPVLLGTPAVSLEL